MNRKSIIQAILALTVGMIAGFYFGKSTNDAWLGGVIGVVVATSSFGLSNNPHLLVVQNIPEKPSYVLLSLITVLVIVTPTMSDFFPSSHIYATSIYMVGILVSGATLGIHIAQDTD